MISRIFDKFRGMNPYAIAGVLVVISAMLFIPVHYALSAGDITITSVLANTLANFFGWIANMLAKILGMLTLLMIEVAQFNNFIDSTAVTKAWVIVRDIVNMIIVLATLYTGVSTILGLQNSYQWNQALPRIVGAAIGVNFSKMIAGVIIDFGQIIMLTFVNAFKNVAAGNLMNALGLAEFVTLDHNTLDAATQNSESILSNLFLSFAVATVMLVIAIVVVAALLAFFIERIVWLWFLVAVSPAAFLGFANAVPVIGNLATQWWSAFSDWVFRGIGIAFTLWLSFAVMQTPPGDPVSLDYISEGAGLGEEQGALVDSETDNTLRDINIGITNITKPDRILSYALALGLLIISLQLAQSAGTLGGAVARKGTDYAKKAGMMTLAGLGGAAATVTGGRALYNFGKDRFDAGRNIYEGYKKHKKEARATEVQRLTNVGMQATGKAMSKLHGEKPGLVRKGAAGMFGIRGAGGENLGAGLAAQADLQESKQLMDKKAELEERLKTAKDTTEKERMKAAFASESTTARQADLLHSIETAESTQLAKDSYEELKKEFKGKKHVMNAAKGALKAKFPSIAYADNSGGLTRNDDGSLKIVGDIAEGKTSKVVLNKKQLVEFLNNPDGKVSDLGTDKQLKDSSMKDALIQALPEIKDMKKRKELIKSMLKNTKGMNQITDFMEDQLTNGITNQNLFNEIQNEVSAQSITDENARLGQINSTILASQQNRIVKEGAATAGHVMMYLDPLMQADGATGGASTTEFANRMTSTFDRQRMQRATQTPHLATPQDFVSALQDADNVMKSTNNQKKALVNILDSENLRGTPKGNYILQKLIPQLENINAEFSGYHGAIKKSKDGTNTPVSFTSVKGASPNAPGAEPAPFTPLNEGGETDGGETKPVESAE